MPRAFDWIYLDRQPYEVALKLQLDLHAAVVAGAAPGALLLLEHPPTITVGRNGNTANLLVSPEVLGQRGVGLHQIDRGGDVTYHGPGQLVGYPILPVEVGVRRFVLGLANAARQVLADLGIRSEWSEDRPGLWTDRAQAQAKAKAKAKIAAVGLNVRRRVATHGFALNVHPDLSHYDMIVPCGLAEQPVTSVHELLGQAPALSDVARAFAEVYQPFAQKAQGREISAQALNDFLT